MGKRIMRTSINLILILLIGLPLTAIAADYSFRQPRCMYVANPGPCTDWVKVWGYDYLTNRCIYYHYGGCGGNPNRFYTKEECIETCRVKKYKRKRVKRDVSNKIDNSIDGKEKDDDMIYVDTQEEEDEDYYERDIDDWKNFHNYHYDF